MIRFMYSAFSVYHSCCLSRIHDSFHTILRSFRNFLYLFLSSRSYLRDSIHDSNHWKTTLKAHSSRKNIDFVELRELLGHRVIRTSNGIKMEEQARGWRINGFENQESLR